MNKERDAKNQSSDFFVHGIALTYSNLLRQFPV